MVNTDDKIAFVIKVLLELLREDYVENNRVKDYMEVIQTKKFVFPIGKN